MLAGRIAGRKGIAGSSTHVHVVHDIETMCARSARSMLVAHCHQAGKWAICAHLLVVETQTWGVFMRA